MDSAGLNANFRADGSASRLPKASIRPPPATARGASLRRHLAADVANHPLDVVGAVEAGPDPALYAVKDVVARLAHGRPVVRAGGWLIAMTQLSISNEDMAAFGICRKVSAPQLGQPGVKGDVSTAQIASPV
jgi:hypothetical protein